MPSSAKKWGSMRDDRAMRASPAMLEKRGRLVEVILYREGLMLVIDKPAGIPVHAGPRGGPNLEAGFDALRFGLPRPPGPAHPPAPAPAGAGAPARPRHQRLPGAGPAPEGAAPPRPSVRRGQGREGILGRRRRH